MLSWQTVTIDTQTARILATLAADLTPILAAGRAARITLNIGSGGNVRIEVATFREVPKEEARAGGRQEAVDRRR